jgi:peptidoglycan/xylan/chitin deacetylase (PgdA/CDA1 family)
VPQLQAAGFKATDVLVQENMQARLADWVKVGQLGHEIGDHTENHPCGLASYSGARFEAQQINPMERFLDANFGTSTPRPYAYPCGYIGLGRGARRDRFARYAGVIDRDFLAARTTAGQPIDPRRAWAERTHLSGFEPTYDIDDPSLAYAYLQRTMRDGNWAILVFHDVMPKRMGEGGTSVAVHQKILDYIAAQPLWCAPMGEVFQTVTRKA